MTDVSLEPSAEEVEAAARAISPEAYRIETPKRRRDRLTAEFQARAALEAAAKVRAQSQKGEGQ